MRWLDSGMYSMDMNLSKPQKIVEERGAWYATIQGVAKSWTALSDWTITTFFLKLLSYLGYCRILSSIPYAV